MENAQFVKTEYLTAGGLLKSVERDRVAFELAVSCRVLPGSTISRRGFLERGPRICDRHKIAITQKLDRRSGHVPVDRVCASTTRIIEGSSKTEAAGRKPPLLGAA